VIVVPEGGVAALAAKAATATIPIVFSAAGDPVKAGLVASLARPGGNLTGINFLTVELSAKRLELLRELVPAATRVAALVNPANATITESTLKDLEAAAPALGFRVEAFKASTAEEIDAAFAAFVRERPDALFVSPDFLFLSRRVQLVNLASRHAIPAAYVRRDYVAAGGLMSYGASFADGQREVGVYTGRILKGAKPADLPVAQSTKFELVINAQAARTIGLAISPAFLSRADEVVE
jgi:putative ABC transport system substrate-binding protein